MKKLIFLFVLVSNFSFAQQWSFFPINDTLCYQKLNSKYITNTLVVSPSNSTNGILYSFSISALPCDTCIHLKGKYYTYQSDFLAKSYTVDSNGNVILNNNSNTSILYINQVVGFSWNFNSSLTATISSVKKSTIFSISDSIKTILFSNGDSMLLSKNNGVILFRHPSEGYLKLVGNHSKKYGERLFDINKYNILKKNDYFNYTEYTFDGSGGFFCDRTNSETYKIIRVDTLNDELRYTCDSKLYSHGYYDCSNFKSAFSTVTYNKNIQFKVDYKRAYLLLNQIRFNSTNLSGHLYNTSSITIYSQDTLVTLSGTDNRGPDSKKYLTMVNPMLFRLDSSMDALFFWYKYPILFENSIEWYFEQKYEHVLGGYIKDGISYGRTDTNIYLATNSIKPFTFSVYPLPNSGEFNIALNDAVINGDVLVSILDLNGRIIFTQNYNEDTFLKVKTTELINGVYLLKINIGDKVSYQKLIIDQNTSQ